MFMKNYLGHFKFSLFGVVALILVLLCGGGGVFTSCNLSDTSNNTVRLVMPGGSARSVYIENADEIDYYNVTINNQKFERLQAGASVESSPITVGATVRVTVEAIGNIKNPNNAYYFKTDRRVAYFETTRTMENGGINISVKMKDYITKYCLINFMTEDGAPDEYFADTNKNPKWVWSDYAEIGKPYTLPSYGVYRPEDENEAPEKHTGWKYGPNNDKFVAAGGSVIVTEDMENTPFTLVAEEFVRIYFTSYHSCFGEDEDWIGDDFVEKGGTYKLPSYGIGSFDTSAARHIGWKRRDGNGDVIATYTKGQVVRITEDMIDPDDDSVTFVITAEDAVELSINVDNVGKESIFLPTDGSIYERNDAPDDPYSISYYFIWPNKPFTLPRAKDENDVWVDEWEITGYGSGSTITKKAGATVSYAEWSSLVGEDDGRLAIQPKSD